MLNYYSKPARSTPLNIAIARVLLGLFLIYKLIQNEWTEIPEWPRPLGPIVPMFQHELILDHLSLLALVGFIALVGFVIGYRLRGSAFLSAGVITVLATVRYAYNYSHSSELLYSGVLLLLLYAVFAEEDLLTIDELRRTGTYSLNELTTHLETATTTKGPYAHSPLRWGLVVVALLYFQAGFAKLVYGSPVEWIQPQSLSRYILYGSMEAGRLPVGEVLLQFPVLLSVLAIATIILEVGFLLAVLAGWRLEPFFIGLFGMHIGIMYALGPLFLDQMFILLLFIPWDHVYATLKPDRSLEIVYDEHCFFCARSLYLFKILDTNDSIKFYSQYTLPDRLAGRDDTDFDTAMYAFRNGATYRGYDGFVELFRQFPGTLPIISAMKLPGIKSIGYQVYEYIGANRSRHFTCAVESDD